MKITNDRQHIVRLEWRKQHTQNTWDYPKQTARRNIPLLFIFCSDAAEWLLPSEVWLIRASIFALSTFNNTHSTFTVSVRTLPCSPGNISAHQTRLTVTNYENGFKCRRSSCLKSWPNTIKPRVPLFLSQHVQCSMIRVAWITTCSNMTHYPEGVGR